MRNSKKKRKRREKKYRDPSNPLLEVSFACKQCGEKFTAEPEQVEDYPEQGYHPYQYSHHCETCGAMANQVGWERAMLATFGKHTGPKTAQGKQICAKNLEGQQTPEQTLRSRFNGMKHGLYSTVAISFPAKPGKYPDCTGCKVDHDDCADTGYCQTKMELFLKHRVALQNRDPEMLQEIHADMQAHVATIMSSMARSIHATGVEIHQPILTKDDDSNLVPAEYTDEDGETKIAVEIKSHPLIKPLGEYISRNTMSLGDLGMTPKVVDETEILQGSLAQKATDATGKMDVQEYRRLQHAQLKRLEAMVMRSQEKVNNDPVLIEHEGQ